MTQASLLNAAIAVYELAAGQREVLRTVAWIVFGASLVPALVFVGNVWLFRRPGPSWNRRLLPPVSVLIPARNEELSIGESLKAVMASRGVNFEVIVLDDGSTDRTVDIVSEAAKADERIQLRSALDLPAGWNGKQFACWSLAGLASFDVFCFLDADVRIGPEALYRMLGELEHQAARNQELALVSGFPRQETVSFLEKLLLPLIHFVLLGFLPLAGERWSGYRGFAAGCGQFMIVRREAYFKTGGHSSIPYTMHDGLLLPQLFRSRGFRTGVFDLSTDAACRMYRNAAEVWSGLSKNATEGMASPARIGVFTWLLGAGEVFPIPLMVVAAALGDSRSLKLGLLAVVFGYGVRVVMAARYKQSWVGVMLHPAGVLVLLVLEWKALIDQLAGRESSWKQRSYAVKQDAGQPGDLI